MVHGTWIPRTQFGNHLFINNTRTCRLHSTIQKIFIPSPSLPHEHSGNILSIQINWKNSRIFEFTENSVSWKISRQFPNRYSVPQPLKRQKQMQFSLYLLTLGIICVLTFIVALHQIRLLLDFVPIHFWYALRLMQDTVVGIHSSWPYTTILATSKDAHGSHAEDGGNGRKSQHGAY